MSTHEIAYLGPSYYLKCYDVLGDEWLHCGDLGGYALGALRMGVKKIKFQESSPVYSKILAIAHQYKAQVMPLDTEE